MYTEFEIDIKSLIINFPEIFKLSDNQQNLIMDLIDKSFTDRLMSYKEVIILRSLVDAKYLTTRREKNLDSLI